MNIKRFSKLIVPAVALFALLALAPALYASGLMTITNQGTGYSKNYTFFTATTTAATSTTAASPNDPGYLNIAGAKKIVMYFSRGATSSNAGTSTFTIQVTPDGTNWYDWNKLSQDVATSTNEWLVSRETISAATSTKVDALDLKSFSFLGIRCIVNFTVDGANTCKGYAEF